MQKIDLSHIIPFDRFSGHEPIIIDLVYTDAKHPDNIFQTALYHPDAKIWAHKDIAAITLLAARMIHRRHGHILCIKDCLRTIDAQEAMQGTKIVKANPHWMEEPDRLLAPPGAGGHPRAMAIDVSLLDANGQAVDMGTSFDTMTPQSHRSYQGFSSAVLSNRQILENAFIQAAKSFTLPFLPLPSEWWDFRFPKEVTNAFIPLCDADLPPQMQMTHKIDNNIANFSQEHFDKLAQTILNSVDEKYNNHR